MIRYALKCQNEHRFESWFQSAEAYERLRAARHVSCPECGDTAVTKAMMAPSVSPSRIKSADASARPDLTAPEDERARAHAKLREEVEKNSEYVGLNFAAEARAIHSGDKPHRSIYGEAKIAEAKKLIEEGVPVAPLPFTPKAQVN